MPEPKPDTRRVIGLALLASAGIMVLVAGLVGVGVMPVSDDLRTPLAAILAVTAVIDGAIGLKFLTTTRP